MESWQRCFREPVVSTFFFANRWVHSWGFFTGGLSLSLYKLEPSPPWRWPSVVFLACSGPRFRRIVMGGSHVLTFARHGSAAPILRTPFSSGLHRSDWWRSSALRCLHGSTCAGFGKGS